MRAGIRGLVARAGWAPACGVLALIAYRRLLLFQPERSLPEELERWFFVRSESVTPVVMVLALWLLFRRIARLRALPPAPGSAWPGALLAGLGLSIYAWATHTGATDLLVPSLAANAVACAWLWRGAAAVRVVWLPVAFLVLAMPIPAPLRNEVVFRLQVWTAEIAGFVLYAIGETHLVASELILRPEATFSVIESCSGMRSMETLALVAVLMMDLFRRRGLHATLVVAAAPVVAFLLNGLRAALLILNPQSGIASIHAAQGVAILLAGLTLLFLLDGLLEKRLKESPPPGPARLAGSPAAAVRARPGLRGAAMTGALGLAALASWQLPVWEPFGDAPGQVTALVRSTLGAGERLDPDRSFLGSTVFQDMAYYRYARPGGDPVLFVGEGMRSHREWSALSPKNGLPSSGWLVESVEPTGRFAGPVRVLRSGARRVLVTHWYEGAGPLWVETVRSLLALDRSRWRVRHEIVAVRVEVPILGAGREGIERARQQLEAFVDELPPALAPARTATARDTREARRLPTYGARRHAGAGGGRAEEWKSSSDSSGYEKSFSLSSAVARVRSLCNSRSWLI